MKFLVTYLMPHEGFDEWMKTPEAQRKEQEVKMQADWNEWMLQHTDVIVESAGVGKPKRITKEGITDSRNDLMMYSFIEADSIDAASAIFKDHPHFGIPNGSIEIMSVNTNMG